MDKYITISNLKKIIDLRRNRKIYNHFKSKKISILDVIDKYWTISNQPSILLTSPQPQTRFSIYPT